MASPFGEENYAGNDGESAVEIEASIRRLRRTASLGPVSLILFLIVSGLFYRFSPDLVLSPQAAKALGPAPSPSLISIVLVFYAFFAILLILCRMTLAKGGCSALSHVGFLSGFFAFYQLGGTLEDNFFPVFIAGLSIIGLETYHAWSFSRERIAEETERLKRTRRLHEWSSATTLSPPLSEPSQGKER